MKAQKLDAPKLPVRVCAGRVGKIGEAKESAGGFYNVLPIDIKGVQGSPDAKVWFLWRPEFFQGGVKEFASKLPVKDDAQDGELTRGSFEFVYAKNINGDDTSLLNALAGSEEKFDELFGAIAETDCSLAEVEAVFKSFFEDEQPLFYFTQQQQREKDSASGDMRRKNQYEVGRFFLEGDAKTMKYYEKKADKMPDEYEITFDPDLPS